MKRIVLVACIFPLIILMLACAPKGIPAEKPSITEATVKEALPAVKEGWQVEWDRVQNNAKKEGKVVIFSTIGVEMRNALAEALKEYGIELEIIAGRGGELAEKLLRERRGGIYSVDLYIAGGNTIVDQMKPAAVLAPLEPLLILPEVKDPKMWYKGKLPFVDKDKTIIAFAAYPSGQLHISTETVKQGDINSMQDLLSPRWKEKIIINDPTSRGRGNQIMSVISIRMGDDYMRQLAGQKPAITRDQRLQIDWISKGRYPIGIGADPDLALEYRRAGAPIGEILLKEALYLTAGSGYMVQIDKAPHPAASRVFLNWLLSKKGQMLWDRVKQTQSLRVDTPVDHLKQEGLPLREPGVDYLDTTDEEWLLTGYSKTAKIIAEVFTPLMK